MAGLDTRGLADGFLQGFQVMDRHQQRKENSRRADEHMEMQRQNQAMRESEHQWRSQDREHQDQARIKAQDTELLGQFWGAVSQGIDAPVTPEVEQAFERNPYLSPKFLFDPSKEESAAYAERLANGEGDLYSPETLQHVNNFFEPDINKGGGRKRLAGLFPGQEPGTFVFDLEVESEDGRRYNAPMTPNHSADDDEVLQLPIEKMINPIMGYRQLMGSMSPEAKQKAMGYFQSIGLIQPPAEQWEQVQGPGGSVLQRNSRTGELKQVVGRENRAGLGGINGYAPSSDVKTLQWLMSEEGGSLTGEEARNELVRLKRGGGDDAISAGDRYRVTYITNQIKEIDRQLEGFPEEEREQELQTMRAQLVQQRDAMASQLGLTGAPPAQPQQQQSSGPATTEADQHIRSLGLW